MLAANIEIEAILIMHAIWKGSISFGLVTIPISLYPAATQEELRFRLLRQRSVTAGTN